MLGGRHYSLLLCQMVSLAYKSLMLNGAYLLYGKASFLIYCIWMITSLRFSNTMYHGTGYLMHCMVCNCYNLKFAVVGTHNGTCTVYSFDIVELDFFHFFVCVCIHAFLKFTVWVWTSVKSMGFTCSLFPGSVFFLTGPFGEHDDEQVFVQRVIPEIDKIYVRLSATGCR